jgi:dUTP pyrophosphatase
MSEPLEVRVRIARVGNAPQTVPVYKTPGSAGLDLGAALAEPVVIERGRLALIPTGWAMAIPPGFEGQVRPRSGLALRHGVTVLNTPGTIDSDYRGEVKVVLINLGDAPFRVSPGDRIAQLVIAPVARATLETAASLDTTLRGAGGYGSTGSGS